MKINKWTLGLAAVGLVSLPSIAQAEEKMNQVWTALSATTISGYVNTSAHWDLGSGNDNLPAYSFGGSGKADGFNLDVVKLTLEKPLDEAQWAAGYKVDLLFGPDANALATTSSSGGDDSSDFGIKQAYVALRAPVGNGLDFKMGVFDAIIGYEVFDAGSNPNYTRSYGYTIEPTTHTGILGTYQFCEAFSASFGVANTFGPSINERAVGASGSEKESYKTYMGSLAFTAPEDWGWLAGSVLYAGIVNGFNANGEGSGDSADQTSYYVGWTMTTPVEGLKVGAAFDYACFGEQPLTRGVAGGDPDDLGDEQSGYAGALGLYASFQATEKLSFHGRGEYFKVSDDLSGLGLPSKVLALTGTVQYDLWKNVISRLEFRWDHQADGGSGRGAYGSTTETDVAGDATDASLRNHYMIALNIIYNF